MTTCQCVAIAVQRQADDVTSFPWLTKLCATPVASTVAIPIPPVRRVVPLMGIKLRISGAAQKDHNVGVWHIV